MSAKTDGVLAFPRSAFFELASARGGIGRDNAVAAANAALELLVPRLTEEAARSRSILLKTLARVVEVNRWESNTLATARETSDSVRDVGPLCGMVFAARVAQILSDVLDDVALQKATVRRDDLRRFIGALSQDEAWVLGAVDTEIHAVMEPLQQIAKRTR